MINKPKEYIIEIQNKPKEYIIEIQNKDKNP